MTGCGCRNIIGLRAIRSRGSFIACLNLCESCFYVRTAPCITYKPTFSTDARKCGFGVVCRCFTEQRDPRNYTGSHETSTEYTRGNPNAQSMADGWTRNKYACASVPTTAVHGWCKWSMGGSMVACPAGVV